MWGPCQQCMVEVHPQVICLATYKIQGFQFCFVIAVEIFMLLLYVYNVKWGKSWLHIVCHQQNNFVSISLSFTYLNFIIYYFYSHTLLFHHWVPHLLSSWCCMLIQGDCYDTRWCECLIFSGTYDITFWRNIWSTMNMEAAHSLECW